MKKLIPLILLTTIVGCAENILVFECTGIYPDGFLQKWVKETSALVINTSNKTMRLGAGESRSYQEMGDFLVTEGSIIKFNKMTNTIVKPYERRCAKVENYFD